MNLKMIISAVLSAAIIVTAISASGIAAEEPPVIVTEAPVTEAPVTEAPVTEAPVTEAPVTEAPVTEQIFDIDENGVLTRYSGTGSSVIIPDGVTAIGDEAFYRCTAIEEIIIPESVEHIGNKAFGDCWNITNINIPSGVKSIGEYAFYWCEKLEEIIIPDGVTSIADNAFEMCKSLTKILIPKSVTNIGYNAFRWCDKLVISCYADSYAEEYATSNMLSYACIDKNKGVLAKYNGDEEDVIIPDWVTEIGYGAFDKCVNLKSVTIPDSVETIGYGAFMGCTNLTDVVMSKNIVSISESAFRNCENLVNITFPDGIKEIGLSAFSGCTKLAEITLPDSMRYIGSYAFNSTAYYENKDNWKDGVLFINNCLIEADSSISGEYVIDDNIVCMGGHAFSSTGITGIHIPESISSISAFAFMYCNSLVNVHIPDSITKIEYDAFYECGALTEITIPESVTRIETYAFFKCPNLKRVTIKGDNIKIDDNVFMFTDCTIYCYAGSDAETFAIEHDIPYEIICYHTNTQLTNQTSSTCTADGYTGDTICSDCGVEMSKGEVIPATGHTEGEWITVTEPTETFEGLRTKSCTVCSEELLREIIPVVEPAFVPGDADGNEKINLVDVSLILKHIAKWDVTIDENAVDVNDDNKINLTDVSLILKYIAKWDNIVLK